MRRWEEWWWWWWWIGRGLWRGTWIEIRGNSLSLELGDEGPSDSVDRRVKWRKWTEGEKKFLVFVFFFSVPFSFVSCLFGDVSLCLRGNWWYTGDARAAENLPREYCNVLPSLRWTTRKSARNFDPPRVKGTVIHSLPLDLFYSTRYEVRSSIIIFPVKIIHARLSFPEYQAVSISFRFFQSSCFFLIQLKWRDKNYIRVGYSRERYYTGSDRSPEFIGSIYMIITPRKYTEYILQPIFLSRENEIYMCICTYDDNVIGKSRGFIENALM